MVGRRIAYLRLPSVQRKQPALHEFGELESVITGPGILNAWKDETAKARNVSPPKQMKAIDVLDLASRVTPAASRSSFIVRESSPMSS